MDILRATGKGIYMSKSMHFPRKYISDIVSKQI